MHNSGAHTAGLAQPAPLATVRPLKVSTKGRFMDIDEIRMGAEISKINFLLENIYAIHMRQAGVSHDAVPQIADEFCRQAMLPGTAPYGSEPSEADRAAQQEIVAHRIATFFAGVQERLRTDQTR